MIMPQPIDTLPYTGNPSPVLLSGRSTTTSAGQTCTKLETTNQPNQTLMFPTGVGLFGASLTFQLTVPCDLQLAEGVANDSAGRTNCQKA